MFEQNSLKTLGYIVKKLTTGRLLIKVIMGCVSLGLDVVLDFLNLQIESKCKCISFSVICVSSSGSSTYLQWSIHSGDNHGRTRL